MEAAIEARKLSKFYSGHRGIDQLTFSVAPGEIFGFLGPNGSGKTTTIRLMLNFVRPSHGSVTLFGITPGRGGRSLRKKIGYLPGELGFPEQESGNYLLSFYGSLAGGKCPLRGWLCQKLQLPESDLRRKVRTYSKGMKQKLGIIQAMQHDPELLILDEPTGGLDPLVQDAFFDVLQELKARGKTIFFSTHVLSETEKICDRVGVLRDGRLVLVKPVQELLASAHRALWVKFETVPGQPPDINGASFVRSEGNWLLYEVGPQNAPDVIDFLGEAQPLDFRFESALEESFLRLYAGEAAQMVRKR